MVVITTESVDERVRFDFWRDVVCRLYVEMETRPLAGVEQFHGSVTGMAAAAVHLTRVTTRHTPHLAVRTPATIARAADHHFAIGLVLNGTGILVQDERTAVVRPGDFAMYDTARPYTLHIDGNIDMLTLRIPQTRMRAVLPKAHAATAVTINGREGTAALVRPLLDNLIGTADSASPVAQRHRMTAAVELIAASLAETASLSTDNPLRAARFARAQQHIEEHLADPELSPEGIARAVFVSPRYLQALFRDHGSSVARYVMERRLDRACHDLTDPRLGHLPIALIAARLGFKRPSHFTFAFKTRFGVGPREHRNIARERSEPGTTGRSVIGRVIGE